MQRKYYTKPWCVAVCKRCVAHTFLFCICQPQHTQMWTKTAEPAVPPCVSLERWLDSFGFFSSDVIETFSFHLFLLWLQTQVISSIKWFLVCLFVFLNFFPGVQIWNHILYQKVVVLSSNFVQACPMQPLLFMETSIQDHIIRITKLLWFSCMNYYPSCISNHPKLF